MDNLLHIELESIKNHVDILIIKITITLNKNPLDMLNSSLNAAEVRISEMENRSVENSKLKDRKRGKNRSLSSQSLDSVFCRAEVFN